MSSSIAEIAQEFRIMALTRGWVWRYPEGERTPEVEEVEEGLRHLFSLLAEEPAGTSVFGGRFVVYKAEEREYDVFIHQGTVRDQ